ncbi:unnamed protein product [Rhizoctonia solani]|uniref:Uncharacterized protein n=1 Tax=Rhizoctonia solani TaxID=456999 RepID=A0A8H3AQD4_9AGAM|nr:unnamed protein product [Rhizoctonia solani]CAE6467439.1 unnamed protein product [Rhizoctonia solani]
MSNFQHHAFSVSAPPRVIPTALPRLFAPEWTYGVSSFSDWIEDCYESNKEALPYVIATKLEKTVRSTLAHEEKLSSCVEEGCDPLYANPFYAYNGYVAALADLTAYIDRLLPQEKNDPFIATLTRTFEKRRQIAHELAEARVQDGFARRIQQIRTSSNATRRFHDVER